MEDKPPCFVFSLSVSNINIKIIIIIIIVVKVTTKRSYNQLMIADTLGVATFK
jgi:hypothetical protein